MQWDWGRWLLTTLPLRILATCFPVILRLLEVLPLKGLSFVIVLKFLNVEVLGGWRWVDVVDEVFHPEIGDVVCDVLEVDFVFHNVAYFKIGFCHLGRWSNRCIVGHAQRHGQVSGCIHLLRSCQALSKELILIQLHLSNDIFNGPKNFGAPKLLRAAVEAIRTHLIGGIGLRFELLYLVIFDLFILIHQMYQVIVQFESGHRRLFGKYRHLGRVDGHSGLREPVFGGL